ncbi:MAG: glycosyltransferase [Acidimicrobiales bacterium]|jgi:vancomycin aglycone glucosyltransferase
MRVLLSTYGGRGDVEPLLGLAVALQELGAEVRMCVPSDRAERPIELGLPVVLAGPPVRPLVQGVTSPSPADLPGIAAEVMSAQFDNLAAAAEGCDALLATGLLPAAASARSVAEKLGIYYVYAAYCPIFLPSPLHAPTPFPGRPFPLGMDDNRELWELQSRVADDLFGESLNIRRAAIGLPSVSNVCQYGFTSHPWLAADPTLGPWPEPADLDVVQTGAWILPDARPLPAELAAFLDAGRPPVYVGFGSMRAPTDIARVAVETIRAEDRRAVFARGWADLDSMEDADDCFVVGEVNQQTLFRRVAAVVHHGGAGTTTAAARAGAPQVVIPQMADQPYWAARVAELGIGAAHDGPTPSGESLLAALRTALDPETRARAAAKAGTIRTDGAMAAAKLLADLVVHANPSVSA